MRFLKFLSFEPSTVRHGTQRQIRLIALFSLFVLPFGTLFYLLTSELSERREFTQRERTGLAYIQPARRVLEDLIDYRSQARRAVISLSTEQEIRTRTSLDQGVQTLEDIDARLGAGLKTGRRVSEIAVAWKTFRARRLRNSPDEIAEKTNQLILSTESLIRHVGDTSNLILDADLTSYYYMSAVVTHLPQLANDTANTRDLAFSLARRGRITPDERRELYALTGVVSESLKEIARGQDIASSENQELKQDWMAQAQTDSITREYTSQLENAAGAQSAKTGLFSPFTLR